MTTFGHYLHELRTARFGLRKFAEEIGENPGTVSKIERDERTPWRSMPKLQLVAEKLGLVEGSESWDRFFVLADRFHELPKVERLFDRSVIPVLLRTVDEAQLTDDQIEVLIRFAKRLASKGRKCK